MSKIRQFAQFCKTVADGGDGSPYLQSIGPNYAALAKLAEEQRVGPLVAAALAQNPHLDSTALPLPKARHYLTRNLCIKGQLLELDRHLQSVDCRAILIKGAVQLFDCIYPNIGMRHLSDIDILEMDQGFGPALTSLGYQPYDVRWQDKRDGQGRPVLSHGMQHLSPMVRSKDLLTIEPHLIATSPIYKHLLPSDLTSTAIPTFGCKNLLRPNQRNMLIVTLIHTLKHDRDTFDCGLLVRGLVECELMYDRLSVDDRDAIAQHFATKGAASFWAGWRALADWIFLGDNAAQSRNLAGFILITEFRLRGRSYSMVFLIAVLHRILAFGNFRYWTSGKIIGHFIRYGQLGFWTRVSSKLRQVFGG